MEIGRDTRDSGQCTNPRTTGTNTLGRSHTRVRMLSAPTPNNNAPADSSSSRISTNTCGTFTKSTTGISLPLPYLSSIPLAPSKKTNKYLTHGRYVKKNRSSTVVPNQSEMFIPDTTMSQRLSTSNESLRIYTRIHNDDER